MAERPLYTLYKNLKAQNYDVPNDYNKFESALTREGKSGADNRHAIYELSLIHISEPTRPY